MNRSTIIRRGVAASIAGAGLTVGGLGIASAADDDTQTEGSSAVANAASDDSERGPRGHGGDLGGSRGPGGASGADLAEALGVSEDELQTAYEAVREQAEPNGDRSTPPAEGEREDRRAEMAEALAAELDLTVDEVTAAFDELQSEREGERRTGLEDRLDEAVTDGDLTDGDKTSVLKAYDAGVLGGGERGRR